MTSYGSSMYASGSVQSLKAHHIRGILLLGGIMLCALFYHALLRPVPDPELKQEHIRYAQARVQLQRETLRRNDALKFYGLLSLLGTLNLSLLIVALGIARARIRAASIQTARIGEHSVIPVREKDLPQLFAIARNLSLAELEHAISTSHDKAYQISRQMVQDMTSYTRALAGPRAGQERQAAVLGLDRAALPIASVFSTPGCAELLRNGVLAPGKPLVIGFSQGQPQYRALHELKSVAVAGWQGSGKTRSMAYLIAAAVITHDVQVFVVDPHKEHAESLATAIRPLTRSGHVTVTNPFETPELIARLNRILDRRLAGAEPSAPGILLVIDELARLAKMEYFDDLITLLERCTEETRKANITFIGGSPKWTARHFKGRADIRGCMNSMLIHKTKPSQADLLLESAQDKKLIKQIQHPGDAILVTDYAEPVVVSMPYCSPQDMELVAEKLGKKAEEVPEVPKAPKVERNVPEVGEFPQAATLEGALRSTPHSKIEPCDIAQDKNRKSKILNLASHRQRQQTVTTPADLTVEIIREQILYRKQHEKGLTQADIAHWADIDPSTLSRILNQRVPLTKEHQQKLFTALFTSITDEIRNSVNA